MIESPFPEITDLVAVSRPQGQVPPLPEIAYEVVDQAQIVDGTPLVKYSATEAGLATLKAELAGKTYDLKTVKGDAAARSDRLRCVTLRTTLEKKRKAFKAPALAYGKLIDTEAARITAEIEALEEPIDAQIKADEQRRAAEKAERERVEREAKEWHAARLAAIAMYATRCYEVGMTAARIALGIETLEQADMTDPNEGMAGELVAAQTKALETMRTLHAQAVAREHEAARQELIRAENERVAGELAAERARIAEEAATVRRMTEALAAREAQAREEQERATRAARDKELQDAIDASIQMAADMTCIPPTPQPAAEPAEPAEPAEELGPKHGDIVPLMAIEDINDWLSGPRVSADCLAFMGIRPALQSMYASTQLAAIKAALITHLQDLSC